MMNITNKIRKDIELYNGIPATQPTTSTNMLGSTTVSSSYTIFTYGTLKIFLLIILILLILWWLYHLNISMNTSNTSMNNYNNTITSIMNNIKSTWNNIIQYIKSITSSKKTTKSSTTTTTTPSSSGGGQPTAHVYIKPEIASKDAIKTALDANALKYTMTVENKDNNTNEVPGWCYIGKDPSGFGVCVQSNNANLCESNMFYDTEDKCINQPATTTNTTT